MALNLIFPATVTTWAQRLGFATVIREALRLAHNEAGRRFRAGAITETQFRTWLQTYFDPRQAATSEAINDLRTSPPVADLATIRAALDTYFVEV
jgi:hypothetical protein